MNLARASHRFAIGVAALASLSACTEAEPTVSRFEKTGELVALSGGDAGARGACITCHGLRGEGDGNLVPQLAGLDPGYFARQLEYFSEGQRRHPQMVWIADHLDWPSRQKVATYYADMPLLGPPREQDAGLEQEAASCSAEAAILYHEGDPTRGLEACATCHGDDGLGVGQGNPPLAVQPAPYLAKQLEAWRSGERYGDPLGAMLHVSQLLRAEEIEPLADYSSRLPGSSSYPELPAACLPEHRPDPRNGA